MNLVSLTSLLPDALFDLRYATTNNITGKVLDDAASIARLDMAAASQLAKAAADFQAQDLRLVIWDAYRSVHTQAELRAIDPNQKYVLELSQHSPGLAVDITLADTSGKLLDMGTDHDEFSERAHADTTDITDEQRSNRQLLKDIMTKHGFVVWPYEWWHFDYVSRQQ